MTTGLSGPLAFPLGHGSNVLYIILSRRAPLTDFGLIAVDRHLAPICTATTIHKQDGDALPIVPVTHLDNKPIVTPRSEPLISRTRRNIDLVCPRGHRQDAVCLRLHHPPRTRRAWASILRGEAANGLRPSGHGRRPGQPGWAAGGRSCLNVTAAVVARRAARTVGSLVNLNHGGGGTRQSISDLGLDLSCRAAAIPQDQSGNWHSAWGLGLHSSPQSPALSSFRLPLHAGTCVVNPV